MKSLAVFLLAGCFLKKTYALSLLSTNPATLSSIQNLRPVVPGYVYRSATLDLLTKEDAQALLEGSHGRPLQAVVDLRNADEIKKGQQQWTDGAQFLYQTLNQDDHPCQYIHVPILKDTDAFWDAVIDDLPLSIRLQATLATAFQGGALDRAAARHLEEGACARLYQTMLKTASPQLISVLGICAQYAHKGPVLFHCQKGKDRTGVVAMLLQACLGATPNDMVEAYALSGPLLGESSQDSTSSNRGSSSGGGTMVDWSHFRGSPESAMQDTLAWLESEYGSVEGYLDQASFGKDKRQQLREKLQTMLQEGEPKEMS